MSKQITVKCYSDFNVKEPYQVSEDAAGHDVFAAETKTFLPKSVDSISLEMIWAIPSGFYSKLFPKIWNIKRTFGYGRRWCDRL